MVHVKLVMTVLTAVVGIVAASWLSLHRRSDPGTVGLSVTGLLIAYEADRQDLTLRTETGDRHFLVREGTPVHEGTKTLRLADLRSAARCRVKVWYREADDRPVAGDIRMSCGAAPPPAVPPTRSRSGVRSDGARPGPANASCD